MTRSTWPPFNLPAPETHLIALGALSLLYNRMEMSLWVFFRRYIENERARNYLFEHLHNQARVDMIFALSEDEPSEDFKEALKHGLDCFNICTENRNFAMHAFSDEEHEAEKFALLKRLRNEPGVLGRYNVPLADVRATAEACHHTGDYFFGLNAWLEERDQAGAHGPSLAALHRPLPERPQMPRKLTLSRRLGAFQG